MFSSIRYFRVLRYLHIVFSLFIFCLYLIAKFGQILSLVLIRTLQTEVTIKISALQLCHEKIEMPHDKTNKITVQPARFKSLHCALNG